MPKVHDFAVIGAGLVGAAVALGLSEAGADVVLLDAGKGFSASRGNFGLVWMQGKGDNLPAYARLTERSIQLWPAFADHLTALTGIDPCYRASGGLELALGEEEWRSQGETALAYRKMRGWDDKTMRLVGPSEAESMLGLRLGDDVRGGVWCLHDGVVNPLRLLRALQRAFLLSNGHVEAGTSVTAIRQDSAGVSCIAGQVRARHVVLAAGLGIPALARQWGIHVPVAPERGQILNRDSLFSQRMAMSF
jgi:glycine/D-amino acid oxidase-like deaminating enzyme